MDKYDVNMALMGPDLQDYEHVPFAEDWHLDSIETEQYIHRIKK